MEMRKLSRFHLFDWILLVILVALFVCICYVNLQHYPTFYNFDLYSDILYATEVWEHRSVFPEGWVFGNQLYVAATPVLAAVIYGITSDALSAMGLASTVMALLVIASFYWMLIPCFSDATPRLFACIVLILLPLCCGDAIFLINGWQLLFTMCSYYACYAITIFWAFGLYIRAWNQDKVQNWISLMLLCCFSLCMGMQSIRQTVIMVLPLAAMECIRFLVSFRKNRKFITASFLIAAFVTVSNLAGVVIIRFLPVDASSILGEFKLTAPSVDGLADMFHTIGLLFSPDKREPSLTLIHALVLTIAGYLFVKKKTQSGAVLIWLILFSIGVVGGIDLLSNLNVRQRYYFMTFPLVAYLAAYYLTIRHKIGSIVTRLLLIVILVLTTTNGWNEKFVSEIDNLNMQIENSYAEVSDYVLSEGYQTLFAGTDLGHKIAVASDLDLEVGFWFMNEPFSEVTYLCNPSVFHVEPEHCVYAFRGSSRVEAAQEMLDEYGLQMELLKHFPESDIYVFTSKELLIELIE